MVVGCCLGLLNSGCRFSVCCVFVLVCWLLFVVCWLLVGCFVVGGFLLFGVRCNMLGVYCVSHVVYVCCLSVVVCCLRFVDWWVLVVVCGFLRNVWCVL